MTRTAAGRCGTRTAAAGATRSGLSLEDYNKVSGRRGYGVGRAATAAGSGRVQELVLYILMYQEMAINQIYILSPAMLNDSIDYFPSLDSIPYINKQSGFLTHELQFMGSKREPTSMKSIDNVDQHQDYRSQLPIHEEQLSIEINENIGSIAPHQEDPEGVGEGFKTPKKKKKLGCVCKKTGCQKMYCECFSSGRACTQDCSCCNCSNTASHNHEMGYTRTSKKAKPKNQQGKTCNCKKSQCLKKYCQCFNSGVPCSSDCKCQGCGNSKEQPLSHSD